MKQRSPLLPIFLIVLVDVLGFTIVIPLLGLYAERFGASPLVATTIVSVYAVCSLISTPIIGRLSDHHGRKRLLIISQAGTCLGFIMLGLSEALWMVFAGRILDGLTAGNLSIAQAYVSDHTTPENRSKAFGVIGIAFGIGFMFGPAIGGWLGAYGMHLPFLAAACLSAFSIFCTYTLLDETKPPQADGEVGPGGRRPSAFDLEVYKQYFRRPKLAGLYVQFFLFTFAFSAFTSGFALFAERRFLWTAKETGYLFAFSGFLGIILQGGLLGRLVKKFGEAKLVIAGFIAAAIAYLVLGFAQTLAMILVAATISSFGNGVLRPVLTSRITQAVGRHEQGVAIGISSSLSSLAMTMAPPVGGAMIDGMWLLAWACVPATVAVLGLLAALVQRDAPSTPAAPADPPSNLPVAKLHSDS
ncbi:MAG: MFS transporter [Deltaproteobacteria bacterium]|nr:MFS transporter [Deltaproteobacteria bacterium]